MRENFALHEAVGARRKLSRLRQHATASAGFSNSFISKFILSDPHDLPMVPTLWCH